VIDNRTFGVAASGADTYAVTLAAGAVLQASTATPAGGPGQFANLLDPRLRILNSSGAQVASDDNSLDGRNALVTFTATAAGTYYVEVSASTATPTPTTGEYVLTVSGNTVTPPPFQVTATNPANGAVLLTPPTTYTVDFNDVVLQTSLQASDLRVDGNNATSVSFLDGDTAVFTLPALGAGTHTVTVAAGALSDVQNTPVHAFTATFFLDNIPPRGTATSIAPNPLVSPRS